MNAKKRGGVRLTKAVAKKIIGRIAPGAEMEDKSNRALGADIYESWVEGLDLVVKCENDWHVQNRLINVVVMDRLGGGSIMLCLDPDTLERNYEAEDELRKRVREREE